MDGELLASPARPAAAWVASSAPQVRWGFHGSCLPQRFSSKVLKYLNIHTYIHSLLLLVLDFAKTFAYVCMHVWVVTAQRYSAELRRNDSRLSNIVFMGEAIIIIITVKNMQLQLFLQVWASPSRTMTMCCRRSVASKRTWASEPDTSPSAPWASCPGSSTWPMKTCRCKFIFNGDFVYVCMKVLCYVMQCYVRSAWPYHCIKPQMKREVC